MRQGRHARQHPAAQPPLRRDVKVGPGAFAASWRSAGAATTSYTSRPTRRALTFHRWVATASSYDDLLDGRGLQPTKSVPVTPLTRLDWLVSFEPGGLLRPMAPLLAAVYKRTFAKDLENLKAMMEAGDL